MSKTTSPVVLDAFQISKSFPPKSTTGLFYDLFEKKTLKKVRSIEVGSSQFMLSNVSFQLKAGEVLGVLGKNGAGKSTLLKILAGIIRPTGGTLAVRAPIIPLLDVGVAIHWDLNGLSNFFLEGTAQGWTLEELRRKMPEIIEYSGLHGHLDKPIKHFSNGMLTRLSLSTAFFKGHSIFLLDEAFGAGDAQFREQVTETIIKKAEKGSAFIVVAHNTDILKKICNRALYLDKGKVEFDGSVEEALMRYYKK